jgi:uncharacterized protein (DUF1800 family)
MSANGVPSSGKNAAALGLHRFGFGPVGDAITAIAADPRGALLADLERPGAGRLDTPNLISSAKAAREVFDFRAERRAQQKLALRLQKEVATGDGNQAPAVAEAVQVPGPDVAAPPLKVPLPQQIILSEAKARFDAAANADMGFVERLVWFWSNHFCVSADKEAAMVGAYEREAIRPHILGRFANLLQAVESHPAMLVYLDNVQSMGADSIAGINRDKGLNENLARETLELHTVGVHGVIVKPTSQILRRSSRVGPGSGRTTRRMAANLSSCGACMNQANKWFSASIMPMAGSIRAAPCLPIWRGTRRPRGTSARNSPGILSPTIRRRRW